MQTQGQQDYCANKARPRSFQKTKKGVSDSSEQRKLQPTDLESGNYEIPPKELVIEHFPGYAKSPPPNKSGKRVPRVGPRFMKVNLCRAKEEVQPSNQSTEPRLVE